jgi:hypothetical protein
LLGSSPRELLRVAAGDAASFGGWELEVPWRLEIGRW